MKDVILSVFSMVLSISAYVASESFSLDGSNTWNLSANPAVYPRLLAVIIFLLGLVHLIDTLRKGKIQGIKIDKQILSNVSVVAGLVLLYIIGVYFIGFVIATTLFMCAAILVGGGSKRQAIIIPLPVALGLFFLFQVLFAVPLPVGKLFS